jgi:hypothetical protein
VTNYTRSAYGPNINAGKDRNNAAQRGWGSGWPNCQTSKMVKVTNGDHSVNVRRELAELVLTLFQVTAKLGYDVNPAGQVNQTWGFACRAIRGSTTASNHSWGLAVDINSLANPMQSTFRSNIPPAVIHAWEVCGFYWGGRYTKRPDTMHLEYIGRPSDVKADLAQARAMLRPATGVKPTPPRPLKDTTLSIWCLQRASTGAPISNECEKDARQLFSVAGHFYPLVLQTTMPAWEAARKANNTQRAGELFQYATKVVQAGLGVKQDGWFGERSGAALHRMGNWTIKAA